MLLLAVMVAATLLVAAPGSASQSQPGSAEPETPLPPVHLDALDPYLWSLGELVVTPGQTLLVTNRGVTPHTFTVREWGVDVKLPTLETVEIVFLDDLEPGDVLTFLCSEPGHQSLSQEGTVLIVTPEEILKNSRGDGASADERVILETRDDFGWSLPSFEVVAGQIVEVRNTGVLEHHFVVDEWDINETISAGEVTMIQAPNSLEVGQQFTFYCSVPGYRAGGMEGVITVVARDATIDESGNPGGAQRRDQPNLGRFLPEADVLGAGWSMVREGNARAVVQNCDNASAPTNQIEDAILNVQLLMMTEWETDLLDGGTLSRIAPPQGCDVANRAAGVTRVYTLPAGSTVCQLRCAGVAIFVAVEGVYAETIGVEAADQVIARLLQRA